MAHQYVHEALGILDESAHGPAFKDVCAQLGIDAAAEGIPVAPPSDEEQRVLDRVAKLLALAESPNENEAQSAMAAAQKLLLKHNLEDRKRIHERGYAYRHVGAATTRHAEHEKILGTLLGKHFFVEAIWIPVYLPQLGKRATVLELIGSPANLEIAAYVHEYLLGDGRGRVARSQARCRGSTATAIAARTSRGGRRVLDQARPRDAEEPRAGSGLGQGRRSAAHFRRRHPRLRTTTFGGGRKRAAFGDGHSAGQQIVLRRGVGGAAEEHGRLLPPRRG